MSDRKRPRRGDASDEESEGAAPETPPDSDGGADAAQAFMQRSQAAQAAAGAKNRRRRKKSGSGAHGDDSEESGEDIMENMDQDYRAIPELDRYDENILDDAEHSDMDIDERRRVERALEERDEREGRARQRSRVPLALEESSDEDDERDLLAQQRRVRNQELGSFGIDSEVGQEVDSGDLAASEPFDLSPYSDTPLNQWIGLTSPRREIQRRFAVFLNTFKVIEDEEDRAAFYREKIIQMCTANKQSLCVSYLHLSHQLPDVAIWLADEPKEMLELFDEVAQLEVLRLFSNYRDTHEQILVRITDLPVHDNLRELREVHLNALIKVSGVVTRRTGVFPQMTLVYYNCKQCGELIGPKAMNGGSEPTVGSCPQCQSSGPFIVNHERTIFRNYQRVTIQESPGSVPAGRVPRRKECVLTHDLIDAARPGQEVEITGIYTHNFDAALNTRQGFPVFATIIVANYIRSKEDVFSTTLLTKEDKQEIMDLSKDPKIGARIINSIAPSIYGMDHVKTAIALSLFGGREKNVNDKHRIRGDINVLLLGDPGVAKSQFLKYVQKTAPRAIYTTGKGASAVGLTAGVHRDPITKEWTLEGGALVLADRGVCMIDEFDKMNDQDRTSIHEAMEQQSISISKAGLVTTLQARCAVLAAANPIGGRYDTSRTLAQNVTLTDPILQRFDILCVCLDSVDPVSDERLARFVTSSHMSSHPTGPPSRHPDSQDVWGLHSQENELDQGPNAASESKGATDDASPGHRKRKTRSLDSDDESDDGGNAVGGAGGVGIAAGDDPDDDVVENGRGKKLSQDILRKYLIYARTHCRPQLHDINQDKLARLYADLRKASAEVGGVPIAVRHIESILRMAEAHARMHLRDFVREDDVDMAIQVMLTSFIGAQKFSVMSVLRKRFKRYLWHGQNNDAILTHVLETMVRASADADVVYGRQGDPDELSDLSTKVIVRLDEFEMKARENEVHDVTDFLKSRDFRRDYTLGEQNGHPVIVKSF